MKKGIFSIIAALTLTCVNAAPARKTLTSYTQPDGSVITLRLCGDEYYHYYTTEDGNPVTLCEDGFYRYIVLDSEKNLVAGSVKASNSVVMDIATKEAIAKQQQLLYQERLNHKRGGIELRRAPMRQAKARQNSDAGDIKGLILLVEFQDKTFTTSQSIINDMMNKEGYTDEYGSIGSARDYFTAQSYGQFKPQFDVIGPITLSNNMSYYGSNDHYGNDVKPDEMVSEACEIASQNGLVNMADYDLNNDGWVDLVYVIYAGYGENIGGVTTTAIWPHAWYIYQGAGRTVIIDGVQLDAYACSSELAGGSGLKPEGIGTFCHEYSHTLGLPDWYDIDYSGGMGMDMWSVMDGGCYAGDGYVPIGYNAYERAYCGWLELTELTEATTITMPELNSDKSAAYRITSSDENQYITLESRKKESWDAGLPAEGMMVVAVDYDAYEWEMNAPNDKPSRQRFRLIPADNRWNATSLEGDLYPYNGNNSLTETSTPKMKIHTTVIKEKPITNIAYNNGVTTFDFMGGNAAAIDAPIATSAGEIANDQFTAYWSRVNDATSYTLYVERLDEVEPEAEAFAENFDKFTAEVDIDVSSTLDDYTMTKGWIGSKVFCNNGSIKLGSSKYPGSITTAAFDTEEQYTLHFTASAYNEAAESGSLTIYTYGSTIKTYKLDLSQIPTGENRDVYIAFDNGCEELKICFDATRRIFMDDLTVINGIAGMDGIGKARINNAMTKASKQLRVTESCMIEGITDTYYTVLSVENPVSAGTYRYKVRAEAEGKMSSWSNVIEVNIGGSMPDALDKVVTNADVYCAHGVIYLKGTCDEVATIYNMQGVAVATIKLSDDIATFAPTVSGMYIVHIGNRVSKVAVAK